MLPVACRKPKGMELALRIRGTGRRQAGHAWPTPRSADDGGSGAASAGGGPPTPPRPDRVRKTAAMLARELAATEQRLSEALAQQTATATENVRLVKELRESLEQQAATAGALQ